jgi:hypothetical protein
VHTITADKQKRVRIPDARPGQVFAYERGQDGTITLHEVKKAEPAPAKARLEKRGRYTVVVPAQPVNMDAVKELLADFP